MLGDLNPDEDLPSWKRNFAKSGKRAKSPNERKKERVEAIENAFQYTLEPDAETVTIADLVSYTNSSEDTVRRHLKESGKFWIEDGKVGLKQQSQQPQKG